MAAAQGNQMNTVPDFDGGLDKDVDIWISHVERAQQQFGWNDAVTAACAKCKCSGKAAYWLQARSLSGELFPNWANGAVADNLRQALKDRFKITINQLAAAEAVTNLKQKRSETVGDFYDRVVVAMDTKNYHYTAAEKATLDYRRNMLSDIYIFFGAGLLRIIKDRATSGVEQPGNAAEYLAAARAAETYLRKKGRLDDVSVVDADDDTKLVDGAQKLSDKVDEMKITGNTHCFRCQGYGHMAKLCATKTQVGRGRGNSPGRGNRGRGSQRWNNWWGGSRGRGGDHDRAAEGYSGGGGRRPGNRGRSARGRGGRGGRGHSSYEIGGQG